MSYIAERRQEEKERRRAEILDAAESVAAESGWDAMTMDQVARRARLSRALLYVYFKDKTDLMFGIGERALTMLRQRFAEAIGRHQRGCDQLEAIGRAYVAFPQEFPVYFEILARCEMHSPDSPDHTANEAACLTCGDAVHDLLEATIERGIQDGSIRSDVGNPKVVGIVLWGFLHGVIMIAATKANVLAHRGVDIPQLIEHALRMARCSFAKEH